VSIHHILILSDARPSRTWRLATRIMQQAAGAEVCGIVQIRSERSSSTLEQMVLSPTDLVPHQAGWLQKFNLKFQSISATLMHLALWWIHACPAGIDSAEFTEETLVKRCSEIECPLLTGDDLDSSRVLKFVAERQPDLAILLGGSKVDVELMKVPRHGWLRAHRSVLRHETKLEALEIKIECLTQSSESPFPIALLSLPIQPYDGASGLTLKADLISDDLMFQSASQCVTKDVRSAANEVMRWAQEICSPYLEQLNSPPLGMLANSGSPTRHRSTWKLCLDTLLLCSPLIVVRNWYRRLRAQYPIVILTHHLVSDRPHRMGIPTESFLRQVQFLQRHYRIVSLSEAIELLKSGRVERPTIVLTFDDGYADNFVSLRAVADETRIPLTLFIATRPVEQHKEFQHDVEFGIHGALPLTWPQIHYWSAGNIEFGAHTRTHFDCGSREKAKLEDEIIGSRRDLEQHLGSSIEFFAFPFGQQSNISAEAVEIARSSYAYFVSGFGGENHCEGRNDTQHLLRRNLYTNAWEQELDLQSVFDFVDEIKAKIQILREGRSDPPPHFRPSLSNGIADNSEASVNASN